MENPTQSQIQLKVIHPKIKRDQNHVQELLTEPLLSSGCINIYFLDKSREDHKIKDDDHVFSILRRSFHFF